MPGGALRVLGGALTNFPRKLRQKFFSALGVQVHPAPAAPPGYTPMCMSEVTSGQTNRKTER